MSIVEARNPFADPLRFERRVPECAIVIFGAHGDLTRRKLMPALYELARERRLPARFTILGTSRTPLTDESYRDKMRDSVKQFIEDAPFEEDLWARFQSNIFYVAGDVGDPELYTSIKNELARAGQKDVLFYLATQPSYYGEIVAYLGAAGLAPGSPDCWRRVVVEKPFGHDLSSARELNDQIHKVFPEGDIYRIDHYLGKETVQNILAFRFGNGIFEPVWNRRYINNVQITAAESIGLEGRGGYYQETGALRDMIQNHLLQLMSTIGMEPPAVYEPDVVRDERAKLLRAVHIMTPEEVSHCAVAGQYKGFHQEEGVDPRSNTETYAAVALFVDNWRWAGVPFYLRTGKRLPKRATEIAVEFNKPPLAMFSNPRGNGSTGSIRPNLLIIRIQPDEGISLRFLSKQPGGGMRLRPVSMDFSYGASFGERSPTAYETLLLDALIGDPTLYTRQDMVDASWRAVQPILDDWSHRKFNFPNYDPGTWGPPEADAMLQRQGHRWRNP